MGIYPTFIITHKHILFHIEIGKISCMHKKTQDDFNTFYIFIVWSEAPFFWFFASEKTKPESPDMIFYRRGTRYVFVYFAANDAYCAGETAAFSFIHSNALP